MAEEVIGTFIGLTSSSYEYIANIIAPYTANFSIELGNFLLIHDSPNKIVARVIDFVPQGELVSFMGQKWLNDVAFEADAIGSDIKKRKISYSVKIKILGGLSEKNKFIPGLRRIPHITSKVVKADHDIIIKILNQALEEQQNGEEIGSYFLDDTIKIKFNLSELDSKRTFIFARAGYGKSNLMKILASDWKSDFGGLIIFDPEGEYSFTDRKERPGIMDSREVILVTNRDKLPTHKNVYNKLRLDLKEFSAEFIVPMIVPVEKHENVFFSKLMSLNPNEWGKLVDLIYINKWKTDLKEIENIMGVSSSDQEQKASVVTRAVLNNLVYPISKLHEPNSKLLNIIESAIMKGEVIIVDISLIDSKTALWLSSMIVKRIFNKNQENFIRTGEEGLLKATFVVEEAQSVLAKDANVSAFIDLAKEGRKYSLGCIYITQQPSSIPFEILSQSDNFFVFHLLSKGDLDSLQRANAHYSNDIITQILNEPIKGKCYMWTSSQPFVLPISIDNFETKFKINKSSKIQDKLLSNLIKEVDEELKNPLFKSITKKYQEIENDSTIQQDKKGMFLFKKLDDDEKVYLRNKEYIQKFNGAEFAVTWKFYGLLSSYKNLELE